MHTVDDILNDDEISNDGSGILSQADLAGSAVEGLEDEARGIMARSRYNRDARSVLTTNDDVNLPLRVPRETDPSIWLVRVKVGIQHCL